MSALRLGVVGLIQDEQGRWLISQRGDFKTWNFPTGRVDAGETLVETVVREVREETGIECEIDRLVSMVHQAGRQRLNLVFIGRAVSGELVPQTDETLDNRFVAEADFPHDLFGAYLAGYARLDEVILHTHVSSLETLQAIEEKLRQRKAYNERLGRPEPEWAHFFISAVLLTPQGEQVLDDVQGEPTMWEQLVAYVGLPAGTALSFHNIKQNTALNQIRFEFTIKS